MSARDRSAAALASVAPPAGFDASLWYRTLFAQSALGRDAGGRAAPVAGLQRGLLPHPGTQPRGAAGAAVLRVQRSRRRRRRRAGDRGADRRRAAFSYEKRYLRADGAKTWVRINLSVLSREDDLYAGIIEDINERKQAEAERALALAQLRDKTDLLARAHEWRSSARSWSTHARGWSRCRPSSRGCWPRATSRSSISVEEYRRTFVHPDDREWSARLAEAAYRQRRARCRGSAA